MQPSFEIVSAEDMMRNRHVLWINELQTLCEAVGDWPIEYPEWLYRNISNNMRWHEFYRDNAEPWNDEIPKAMLIDDILVPLMTYNTPDKGPIHGLLGEVYVPVFADRMARYLASTYPEVFKYEDSRGEYVIDPQESFDAHRRNLSQVGRSWNRNKDLTVERFDWNTLSNFQKILLLTELVDLVKSNIAYFDHKRGPVFENLPYDDLLVTDSIREIMCSPCQKLIIHEGDRVLGIILIDIDWDRREVYWVNSVLLRNEATDRRALGNWSLLKLLEWTYTNYSGWGVNMGLDVFQYKLAWKPRHVTRKALTLCEPS